MARKAKLIFLDTSFLKALVDGKDDFHSLAESIWSDLKKQDVKLVCTNFIFDELFTLLRKRCGLQKALDARSFIADDTTQLLFIRITIQDEANAWIWFPNDWSDLSFTDCTSFAVMKRLDITHVATFDQHFQRAGFTIVKPMPATLQKNTE